MPSWLGIVTRPTSGGQRVYGGGVGAALAGDLRGDSGCYPVRGLSPGMAEDRSPVGVGKAPDHRGGYLPAEGLFRPGAPPSEDPRRAAGTSGRQDRRLHLRSTDQRLPGPAPASPGGPVGIDQLHITRLRGAETAYGRPAF